MGLQSTISGVELLATTEITVFLGGLILGMFIPSNVEFGVPTCYFEAIRKGGYIFCVSYKRGRWILRVMDKNTTTWDMLQIVAKKTWNGYDVVTEFSRLLYINRFKSWSVNLKDFLRFLMKPPNKKHVISLEKFFAWINKMSSDLVTLLTFHEILIGSKGSLQWLITIPT